MKKVNWENFENNAKALKRNVKNLKAAGDYLQDMPPEGFMRDNISKNIVKIKDCKSSSLRRYVKLLDNFYYLVSSQKDKQSLLNKKIEIEMELGNREDGLIEK